MSELPQLAAQNKKESELSSDLT